MMFVQLDLIKFSQNDGPIFIYIFSLALFDPNGNFIIKNSFENGVRFSRRNWHNDVRSISV